MGNGGVFLLESRMQSFVDEVVITVSSGHGGAGCVSFRREKYVPRGGPDGGDGGRGGDVQFIVRRNLKTLSEFHMFKEYRAGKGHAGSGRKCQGQKGKDLLLEVPPGTQVRDADSNELLLDLVQEGKVHFLSGGIGGLGNYNFATSRNQAPRHAQDGKEGEERKLRLELSIIADIGFVGFPNAGKSSLLKVLTAADPKIGNYPFTTKIPNLGVMRRYHQDLVLADIPGIIEGASQGAGLGLKFLKHIRRTKALAFVIDSSDFERSPGQTISLLEKEMSSYAPQLLQKPRIIVLNKIDIPEAREGAEACLKEEPWSSPTVLVSATNMLGIEELGKALYELYEEVDPYLVNPGQEQVQDEIKVPEWMKELVDPEDPRPELEGHDAETTDNPGDRLLDQLGAKEG